MGNKELSIIPHEVAPLPAAQCQLPSSSTLTLLPIACPSPFVSAPHLHNSAKDTSIDLAYRKYTVRKIILVQHLSVT